MTINKFTGKTKEEAIECAKQAFGPNAVIMNIKEIKPKGLFGIFKSSTYEVTAAMDEKKQTQTITTSQLARTTLPGKIYYKADEEIKLPRQPQRRLNRPAILNRKSRSLIPLPK